MDKLKYFIPLLFITIVHASSVAQRLKPEGQFLSDSLKIGEVITYSLSVSYPSHMDILFPDSSYNYAPFEFVRKEFFPTRLDSITAFDSAVYHLSSFEIDRVQYLTLPVFIVAGDSIPVYSSPDSVQLQELIEEVTDSLALKSNVEQWDVNRAFNYPYLLIGIGVFVALSILVYLVFGKQISRRIKLYRLRKKYEKFIMTFQKLINEINRSEDAHKSEEVLLVWKEYMESLDRIPYTKLTTKEIVARKTDQEVKEALRTIDRNIYGRLDIEDLYRKFEVLEDFTTNVYSNKVLEVKNG